MKKIFTIVLISLIAISLFAGGSQEKAPLKIGVPDDATNQARAIKLLETAGLITVDPSVGYSPEIKHVTSYIYNIEIVPTTANTLVSTLDDFGASTINGTYATAAGYVPSRDAILIETQDEGGNNPFVNIIVARSSEKDNPVYKKVVEAYQTELVAEYLLAKYKEAYFPAFPYDSTTTEYPNVVEDIDSYVSTPEGKTVVKIGVCGAANEYLNAVQKVLDDRGDNIYIQRVEFDAYNLPNEALNNGDIDLNAFQHKAYLNKEIAQCGYKIEAIGDTLIAPLSLYSKKAKSVDELKELAGKN
ncbi:MAG: MetQ/NlpA family ABC transporter substrate-binding protein [Spirochaetales bacterium]|nr:MetQ/NlpA family ABC transporter substrate-binding protein [Spirochaetales bacterium]